MSKFNKALARIRNFVNHKADQVIMLLHYYIVSRKRMQKHLNISYEHIKLHPFNVRKWHNKSAYYYGEVNGKKEVFIKESLDKQKTLREVEALKLINKKLGQSTDVSEISTCKLISFVLQDNTSFVVESYIDAEPMSNTRLTNITSEQRDKLLQLLLKTVMLFRSIGLMHCDFTPKNIYITEKCDIIITDFEYAQIHPEISESKPNIFSIAKYPKDLGGRYAFGAGIFDDAYSLLCVEKYICPTLKNDYADIWRTTNKLIGTFQLMTV